MAWKEMNTFICNGILPSCAQTPQCALLVCLLFTKEKGGSEKPQNHHEAPSINGGCAETSVAPKVDPSFLTLRKPPRVSLGSQTLPNHLQAHPSNEPHPPEHVI